MALDLSRLSLFAQAVRTHARDLFQDRNVTAVAVGRKMMGGHALDELAVTVFVLKKLPPTASGWARLAPKQLEIHGQRVDTDVVEAAPFYQQANTARIRPARPGTSIGEVSITAGTFGAIVLQGTTQMILSNNHVLADNNRAPLGSSIVQPGPYDGGAAPGDTIALLAAFEPIVAVPATNTIDAAIAEDHKGLVSNDPLNGVPKPSAAHPAVGLIWGGDGVTYTAMSPIETVLRKLNVRFPEANATIAATMDMEVEKTGRTTERTTGKVTNLHGVVRLNIPHIGDVEFVEQIFTTKMSEGGDSGSVAVKR